MSTPADEVRIDRLALRVAGLDEDAARELARLVAERLAPGMLWPAGQASVHHLAVEVPADATNQSTPQPPDLLAQRIVAQIGRVLARDRASGGPGGEVAG